MIDAHINDREKFQKEREKFQKEQEKFEKQLAEKKRRDSLAYALASACLEECIRLIGKSNQ